jgi:hypothetical protein
VDGDCAAVLQRVRMSATVLGEDRSGQFVISDVWRRRGGSWKGVEAALDPAVSGEDARGRELFTAARYVTRRS